MYPTKCSTRHPRTPRLARRDRLRAFARLTGPAIAALSLTHVAHGQTWINPNTGSWSVGGNWIGGVVLTGTTTQLTFNAVGTQSYSSFNNIVAPFTLNRMIFNNTGTGVITISGLSLEFAGANPGVTQNGSGAVTLNNVISMFTTASSVNTVNVSGSGSGTLTFNGALVSGVAPTPNNGANFRNDNPNGNIFLAGGGNLFGLSANTGSVTVTTGTQTSIVASAGINAATVGTLTVTGPTAVVNTAELDAGVNAASTGNLIASNGGKFLVTHGNAFLGSAQNITGDFLGSFANVNITGPNSAMTITGNGFSDSTGILLFAQGATGATSAGTMNITGGGSVSTVAAFVGERDGTATINVSGSGSQFTNTDQFVIESTAASRLNISSAGKWVSSGPIYTSSNPTDNAVIAVTGNSSLADWSASPFDVLSGGLGIPGGNTTLVVTAGGEIRANLIYAAENENGRADMTIDGANSRLTLVGSAGRSDNTLLMGDDLGTNATLNVTGSGRVTIGAGGALVMTNASTASAMATFSGPGTLFDASAPGAQLLIGGSGTTAAGIAAFSLSNNAAASVNDLTMVYTRGTLNIGAGTSPATFVSGQTNVNGTINFNSGTFNTTNLSVGGQVLFSSAARDAAGVATNKKVLEVGLLAMTGSGVIDLNDNDAIFHATPIATVQSRIAAARNAGAWNAPGITSTAAKNANPKNTSLGAITGTNFHAALGAGATFNGRTVANTDVLVKYTFYGDTDLNGVVNFDDYARTDSGFNNQRGGWFNGDFDYNGAVNFDDYSLIDLAFNTQGTVVLSTGNGELAGPGQHQVIGVDLSGFSLHERARPKPMQQFGGSVIAANFDGGAALQAVPEPSSVFLLALATLGLRRRRPNRSTN